VYIQKNRLLNYLGESCTCINGRHDSLIQYCHHSAYVVSTQNDVLLKNAAERSAFEKKIQKWIKSKVAGHKQLRGVLVIAAIPKSAAGKILRKDLRALAAKEGVQAKL
jgi:acyl-coenzyme A synthetase/AMP-(fatty) acid ligase